MAYNDYNFPHTRDYDSDLGFLICEYKRLLAEYKATHDTETELIKQIEEMEKRLDEYVNGGFIDQYLMVIEDWIINNIGEIFPAVFFGITDTGYFFADIPKSWRSIHFYTSGYDYAKPIEPEVDYGHLIMEY